MVNVKVVIHEHEKEAMLKVIKKNKGATVSVAKLASQARFNPNRSRFIIEELLQEGKIKRVPTKAFGPRYIRYSYEIV